MIKLATGYKDLMRDGYTNCPARTQSCEGKGLKGCRMCAYYDCIVTAHHEDGVTEKHAPMNCPNCGAPITGERCEYCGSVIAPPDAVHENEEQAEPPIYVLDMQHSMEALESAEKARHQFAMMLIIMLIAALAFMILGQVLSMSE